MSEVSEILKRVSRVNCSPIDLFAVVAFLWYT